MLHTLMVTFPFFAVVLCGYVAARTRVLPMDAIAGLNVFVLYFALPCMLYRFGANTPIANLLDVGVIVTYLACALTMLVAMLALTRRGPIGWNDASFGALVSAFPNSGFLGVPLLVALLGAQVSAPVIVSLTVDMVITSSLCIGLSRLDAHATHGVRSATFKALSAMAVNPLPWAILLGGAASATHEALPGPLMRAVDMLADAASPTALFTIGAVLARARRASPAARAWVGWGDAPLLVAFKLLVHPVMMLGLGGVAIGCGLRLSRSSLNVLVLVAALPSASNVPMLAERFGADSARVARIVLLSTALAFLSFSAAVALVV